MAEVLNVKALEQLAKFVNKDGYLEIALRQKNKRFAAFQKVALNNIENGDGKDLMQKAFALLNKNNVANNKAIHLINNVAKLQQLSMLLSGLNLCATCAGFAIMNAKLDKMSGQINQLMNVAKQGNDVQSNYEFKKVLSEYHNMLDCRKKQKYYTEEQMRKLVDDEFNVLNMLVDVFMRDIATDVDNLLFSIYTLAAMASTSLRFFDEVYYFNNHEAIGEGDIWHSSHGNWVAILKKLASPDMMRRIQDHGFLDLNLSTVENDVYYMCYHDQIMSMLEDIRDNQEVITMLNDQQLMGTFAQQINNEVAEALNKAFEQTEGCLTNDGVQSAFANAMKQVVALV